MGALARACRPGDRRLLEAGESSRKVRASSHCPSHKGPPRPATQASATLPAPSPDHSNLKLRTDGRWVGGNLGGGDQGPHPRSPGRLPSSHPLDLKQLHVGVIPHGWIHVPGEGVGCHRVLGGPTEKTRETPSGGKAQTPPTLVSRPGQWMPSLHQVDCLDTNQTTMVGPRAKAHAEPRQTHLQEDAGPTRLVPALPAAGPTSDK